MGDISSVLTWAAWWLWVYIAISNLDTLCGMKTLRTPLMIQEAVWFDEGALDGKLRASLLNQGLCTFVLSAMLFSHMSCPLFHSLFREITPDFLIKCGTFPTSFILYPSYSRFLHGTYHHLTLHSILFPWQYDKYKLHEARDFVWNKPIFS